MKTGIELIAAERERQITSEGWTPEHDDACHSQSELTRAAISYARHLTPMDNIGDSELLWPFDTDEFKPSGKDPIRNLVKAGALIAAEIDRLQRKGAGQ